MNVPLRLARIAEPSAAADAFFLFASNHAPLATACECFAPHLPEIFAVRGGFLLVAQDRQRLQMPGAIRLRRLGGDLFLPVDASLLPALLSDEIASLTRDRGLVVLPGGTILTFDPHAPLPLSRWLQPTKVVQRTWETFPEPPELADRLTRIERPSPPAAVIEILSTGEPDDTERLPGAGESGSPVPEEARPSSGSSLGRMAAGLGMGAGQFLSWLGRQFAMPGLAKLGANLARKAIERIPRLTEKLFGEQEAALREVLRELQSGDIEKGLRRAPPAVPDPDAPAQVGTDANLGRRDPRYSLRDLIGSGGVGTAWLGGGDVWGQLAREYRRLAQEAAARGDHRRAAYLYGVLLRDMRSAANALLAGGLFRDAAILFRDKLKDAEAAAVAFEKAGEFDEALLLYDRLGRLVHAAELLQRIGDDERAMQYFVRAADQHAAGGRWLAAGELIWKKAGDRIAAMRYFRGGWSTDGVESIACGEWLLLNSIQWVENREGVSALLDEAERRFQPPRHADAGRFFNYAAAVGSEYLPAEESDDLVDRTRNLFAKHLRTNETGRSTMVSDLFGKGVWTGPTVRDAAFAVRAPKPAVKPRSEQEETREFLLPMSLADGATTAVVVAKNAFHLVVATTTSIVLWRVSDGEVIPICSTLGERILGLSVDAGGNIVYMLSTNGSTVRFRCYVDNSKSFRLMAENGVDPGELVTMQESVNPASWYLEPSVGSGGIYHVTLAGPGGRETITGWYVRTGAPKDFLRDGVNTHLLLRHTNDCLWDWDDRFVRCLSGKGDVRGRWTPHWTPAVPEGCSLTVPRVDCLTPAEGILEVVGVDADGHLHWSRFDASAAEPSSRTASADSVRRFTAACLVSPGLVVAAQFKGDLVWLRGEGSTLQPIRSRKLGVSCHVAALVARSGSEEIVVVLDDGSAARVPGSISGASS